MCIVLERVVYCVKQTIAQIRYMTLDKCGIFPGKRLMGNNFNLII